MAELVPCEQWMVDAMDVQEAQSYEAHLMSQIPEGSVCIVHEGEPLLIGGCIKVWEGRYVGWCFMSRHAGPHMFRITHLMRDYVDSFNAARVEMTVRSSFKEGHRWAELLGFELEGTMRNYRPGEEPENRDECLYARIKV